MSDDGRTSFIGSAPKLRPPPANVGASAGPERLGDEHRRTSLAGAVHQPYRPDFGLERQVRRSDPSKIVRVPRSDCKLDHSRPKSYGSRNLGRRGLARFDDLSAVAACAQAVAINEVGPDERSSACGEDQLAHG